MSDNHIIERPPEVVERLVEIFGADKLALVLKDYALIQAMSGHGEINLVIYDGKCKGVEVTLKQR